MALWGKKSKKKGGSAGVTILFADDEPDIREVVEATLMARDYNIVMAVDGNDALEKIAENKPDLVILDIQMPGKTGLEVLEAIRENPEQKNLPVIIMTAMTTHSRKTDDYWKDRVDVQDYISKPFDPLDLLARIDKLVEKIKQE